MSRKNKIIVLGISGGSPKRNFMHLSVQQNTKANIKPSKKAYNRKKEKITIQKDLTKY